MPERRTLPGHIPVRVELADGTGMWRGIRDLTDHAELCRKFNLDPISTSFDLPSSARGVGRLQVGYGGDRSGRISGIILRNKEPIGKLIVAWDSERFRDVDPSDMQEFYKL